MAKKTPTASGPPAPIPISSNPGLTAVPTVPGKSQKLGTVPAVLLALANGAEMWLSAAGCAEFHPMDDNNTVEGRARNRRIDIVILNPVLVEKSPLSPDPAENPPPGPAPSETHSPSTGQVC